MAKKLPVAGLVSIFVVAATATLGAERSPSKPVRVISTELAAQALPDG